MRLTPLVGALAGAFCFALLSAPAKGEHSFEQAEVARIRQHLAGAEDLLSERDLSALTDDQRRAREARVADLKVYRARGVFPHNHQRLNESTPVFIDEHGTPCAMAFLIQQSGAELLARRIADTRNLARIHDLANDAELVAWLDENGITPEEAARIQPAYGGYDPEVEHGRLAAIALGVGGFGVGLNLTESDSRTGKNIRGLTGLGCGLFSLAVGSVKVDDAESKTVGAIDIGLGLAAFALAVKQLVRPPAEDHAASALAISPATWRDGDGVQRYAIVARF